MAVNKKKTFKYSVFDYDNVRNIHTGRLLLVNVKSRLAINAPLGDIVFKQLVEITMQTFRIIDWSLLSLVP